VRSSAVATSILSEAAGMVAAYVASNETFGNFFDATRAEAAAFDGG
jgi:hypothetical protein